MRNQTAKHPKVTGLDRHHSAKTVKLFKAQPLNWASSPGGRRRQCKYQSKNKPKERGILKPHVHRPHTASHTDFSVQVIRD